MSYLRNWSLVVPVCMNELAITVAVWQTEFRTASYGARKKVCHLMLIMNSND